MGTQKRLLCVISFLFLLIFTPAIGSAAGEVACANLASTILANPDAFELGPGVVTITSVPYPTASPTFCRVSIKQYHAINIEVGLPFNALDNGTGGIQGAWNGKIQNNGGGGFAGSVGAQTGAGGSNKMVQSGTDSGHSSAWCNSINPDTGEPWSLQNCGSGGAGFVIDRNGNLYDWQVTDFITDSLYAQVKWALDLTQLYYGRKQNYNYWNGCSTGGRQGWEMAQKYGDLFDGILAGAPAMYWNRFQTGSLWPPVVVKSLLPGTTPTLSTAKSNAAIAAAVAACSEFADGIVNEPRRCTFDARSLICPAEGTPPANCLTPEEADAINMIWYGPTNPEGYRTWGGPAVGTSFGVALAGGNQAGSLYLPYEQTWVHQDPNWQWATLAGPDFYANFTAEMKLSDQKFQETASTDNPDLTKAKQHGTKIIHYHGLADSLIFPFASWNYASRLIDRYGMEEAQSFVRSFFLPNQGHCGAAGINFMNALTNWVENGVPPDYLDGTVATGNQRRICMYPNEAVYTGSDGNMKVAANFTCIAAEAEPTDLRSYTNLGPIMKCKDATVSADATCSATTALALVDDGSSDRYGDPITLVQEPEGPYALGSTPVTLTGTDWRGEANSCDAAVKVVDTTPPSISSVKVSPNILWPPNHKMVPVAVGVTVTDACDAGVSNSCRIVSVTSNEPVNGPDDGNTSPDWQITGNLTLNLRAERSGTGSGRIYTVNVACTDASGNSSAAAAAVKVPLSQGK
jgi:feruloyl esterase